MPARTIKGFIFTVVIDGKRITVKHLRSKGKRCRVIVPEGAIIETDQNNGCSNDESDGERNRR